MTSIPPDSEPDGEPMSDEQWERIQEDIAEWDRRVAATCYKIGRFVYAFSQMEHAIKSFLADNLGLDKQHRDAVLSNMDFARACDTLEAILNISLASDPHGRLRSLRSLVGQAKKLNADHRLVVAHGVWERAEQGLVARKVSREKAVARYYYEQQGELDRAADAAMGIVLALHAFE